MAYVIQVNPTWSPMVRCYVRVYKNGREWVTRLHTKTASQFETAEKAMAIVTKFELGKHRASVVSA